jgi:hypothetical protein
VGGDRNARKSEKSHRSEQSDRKSCVSHEPDFFLEWSLDAVTIEIPVREIAFPESFSPLGRRV